MNAIKVEFSRGVSLPYDEVIFLRRFTFPCTTLRRELKLFSTFFPPLKHNKKTLGLHCKILLYNIDELTEEEFQTTTRVTLRMP